jgi:WD40 repeat protein
MGKRWGRWRALDVFLDEHDLATDPELERKLFSAIEDSEYFIFLASVDSAEHDSWCSKEIAHWFEVRREDAADKMRFVITNGHVAFTTTGHDAIDWTRTTAAPKVLEDKLRAEPFYLDLTSLREQAEHLDIRDHPQFRAGVCKLAAPLHGCSPQELDSEDRRQFRRGRRLRRLAVAALCVLTVAAIALAIVARDRQQDANDRARQAKSRALAREATANAGAERDLALLQALESVRVAGTTDAWGSLLGVLTQPTHLLQRSTEPHSTPVTTIDISDDGSMAVTGDGQGNVVVWDLAPDATESAASPRPIPPLPGLTGAVLDVGIFERDGAAAVGAVASDGSSIVWDPTSGEELPGVLVADPLPLLSAAISEDGSLVAVVADTDGDNVEDHVQLYRDGALEPAATTAQPHEYRYAFALAPDGKTVAWAEDFAVHVWDLSQLPRTLTTLTENLTTPVTSLAFQPDGTHLAVAEEEGVIWLVDLSDPGSAFERVVPQRTSRPTALAFAPDAGAQEGDLLVSSHANGEVNVWTVDGTFGFAEGEALLGHKEETTSVAAGPGGRLVSGSWDGQVLWWDAQPTVALGKPVRSAGAEHTADVKDVAFLDDEVVVSVDGDGHVITTNLESGIGTLLDDVDLGANPTMDTAGDTIVLQDDDGLIEVGFGVDYAEGFTIKPQADSEGSWMDLSDDGTGLVVVDSSGLLRMWDVPAQRERSRTEMPDSFTVLCVLYGADGRVWVGGGDERAGAGVVYEVDSSSGAIVGDIVAAQQPVSALALSADARRLATGSLDRAIRLWDAETYEALERDKLVGHREWVTGLAFTRDGRSLVSSDGDLRVNYWDVAEGRLVTTFRGPIDGINALAMSPDGTSLVVASEDDAVYWWPMDRDTWLRVACEQAGRNMTPEEWQLYGSGPQRRLCKQYGGEGPPVEWTNRLDA